MLLPETGWIRESKKTILINGALNAKIVGQKAATIAEMAGVAVLWDKNLIGEVESVDISEELHMRSYLYLPCTRPNLDEAIAKAEQLVADGGYGHTSALYIDTREKERWKHAAAMKTCRISSILIFSGRIGDLYNFKLVPSWLQARIKIKTVVKDALSEFYGNVPREVLWSRSIIMEA